jgi:peptide/nickel transport system permease protein
MSWLRFVGTRIAASCVLLFVLLSAVFAMSVALIPGDFATLYRLSMRAEDVELIRTEMGLDQPWWIQLGRWLSGVVRGDLGTSFTGVDVTSAVFGVLPFTLLLLVFAVGAAFTVGVWLAGWQGGNRPRLVTAHCWACPQYRPCSHPGSPSSWHTGQRN